MTTGEGGMVATDDPILAEKIRKLRHHGIERDPQKWVNENIGKGPWYYEMQELGFNYRLTDIQCALGRSQLKKLDRFIERRQEIVSLYNCLFAGVDHVVPPSCVKEHIIRVSWHLYTVLIDFEKVGIKRSELMDRLRAEGVASQVLYIPVYQQPRVMSQIKVNSSSLPNMELYYRRSLSLPLHFGLRDENIEQIAEKVASFLMKLLIRADANAQIGVGHVMRMIALGQAWMERGGKVCFCYVECPTVLLGRLVKEGFHIRRVFCDKKGSLDDASFVLKLATQIKYDWLVLDGYHFDYEYQKHVSSE